MDDLATRAAIGRLVKGWRKKRGWNQADLAEAAALSRQTISKVEKGANTDDGTLDKIATVLGFAAVERMTDDATRDLGSATATPVYVAARGDHALSEQAPEERARVRLHAFVDSLPGDSVTSALDSLQRDWFPKWIASSATATRFPRADQKR